MYESVSVCTLRFEWRSEDNFLVLGIDLRSSGLQGKNHEGFLPDEPPCDPRVWTGY